MKLPPPWLRERDALERLREVHHLMQLQEREQNAIACGFNIRPKPPVEPKETKK